MPLSNDCTLIAIETTPMPRIDRFTHTLVSLENIKSCQLNCKTLDYKILLLIFFSKEKIQIVINKLMLICNFVNL